MRIRSALAVAVGTGVLVVALPAVASAATGDFTYKHVDEYGHQRTFQLTDPPSRECITLRHAEWSEPPADSPHNRTDATATVFTGRHCDGEWYSLRPFGGRAGERLKLRSVVFS